MSKILLIGDSFTAYMPNNLIGTPNDEVINAGVVNTGIKNYRKHVLPTIIENEADIVVVLIGLNNILNPNFENDNSETLQDTVKKMIDFINDINRMDAKIIIQSVYPTRNSEVNKKIQAFNDKICEHCYHLAIEFLDIYEVLTDTEGLLREKYTNDGLHPNMEGYSLIANQINEFFLMYDYEYFK